MSLETSNNRLDRLHEARQVILQQLAEIEQKIHHVNQGIVSIDKRIAQNTEKHRDLTFRKAA